MEMRMRNKSEMKADKRKAGRSTSEDDYGSIMGVGSRS
jgi:hypothetical protein